MTPPALELRSSDGTPVVQFMTDGRVFWQGREVVGDEDFITSIKALSKYIEGVATVDVAKILEAILPESRLKLFETFCKHCGNLHFEGRRCNCWNDE